MSSDQQVNSRLILQTLQELQRCGITPAMQHLEQIEPDLASYLMESLTSIYHQLLQLGTSAKKGRRVYRQVQTLAMVVILALRKGHYELWKLDQDFSDEESDPPPPPPLPPPPPPRPRPDRY